MKLRNLLSLMSAGAALLGPSPANAADPEAVRLEVDAPPGCVDESAFRDEIGVLGGHFRDANLDDRARTFRIEVARGNDDVKGRLIVRDLVFRESIRELRARSCVEAIRSLALFAATALDQAPPPLSPAPSEAASPPPPLWPAPTRETDRTRLERAPRLGSGGLTVGGVGGVGTSTSAGFHASGALRFGRTTRLGIAGAIVHEERAVNRATAREESRGLASRVGALVGWGAPWNDGIVGFATELGIAWGERHGATIPARPGESCDGAVFGPSPCFDRTRAIPARWSFVTAYVAPQLVLQVPFKDVPVRPIASLGLLFAPAGMMAATAETGIVWQAW